MLRRSLLVAVSFVVPTIVSADPAVEAPNGTLGLSAGKSRMSGEWSDGQQYSIDADVTLPVGGLVGIALRERYSLFNNDGPCGDFVNRGAEMEVFMRDPSVGRVGISYGRGVSDTCGIFGSEVFTGEVRSKTYGINAEYYLDSFTFGADGSRSVRDEGFDDVDAAFANALWYPDVNLSVGFSTGMLDVDHIRTLSVEYQPELFGGNTSVSLGILNNRAGEDSNTVTLGVTYYWGSDKTDLKTKDRNYR